MIDPNIVLGIDLGTTNSLSAWMTDAGPEVIREAGGASLVPSVIALAESGEVTVGSEARAPPLISATCP